MSRRRGRMSTLSRRSGRKQSLRWKKESNKKVIYFIGFIFHKDIIEPHHENKKEEILEMEPILLTIRNPSIISLHFDFEDPQTEQRDNLNFETIL